MKRILISGLNGYIGNSFEKWLVNNHKNEYSIDKIDLRNEAWKSTNLGEYEVIVHLASIVHSSNIPDHIFYEVNSKLSLEFAQKAKQSGVKHFIFFSSLSVYAKEERYIDQYTTPMPSNTYGKSKLEAELNLLPLEDDGFKITIIRPPMVYGPKCPGNFNKLIKFFTFLPVFINIKNQRSMIYIENLCTLLFQTIKNGHRGILLPQNKDYVQTTSIYSEFKSNNNKKYILVPFKLPKILLEKSEVLNKIFGDLIIEKNSSMVYLESEDIDFKESIKRST